jgi:AraC-like DNA-binding protein
MAGCGTAIYTDPEDYRLNVPGATIDLVPSGIGPFRARVTWAKLRHLRLVLVEETRARAAFVSLDPSSVFVSFSLSRTPSLVWNGVETRRGDLVFHRRRDGFHQLTRAANRWGLISISHDDLAFYARALLHTTLASPRTATLLKPPADIMGEILRLHTQGCRLARTTPDMMAHHEVARALEQDLISALVNGLLGREAGRDATRRRHHAAIMARFERALARHDRTKLPMDELSAAAGVSERALRRCCAEFLGMPPTTYARLRRLNLVRADLLRGNVSAANIATAAKRYGFSELGRFAAIYRAAFGESPSATLRPGRSNALAVAMSTS